MIGSKKWSKLIAEQMKRMKEEKDEVQSVSKRYSHISFFPIQFFKIEHLVMSQKN